MPNKFHGSLGKRICIWILKQFCSEDWKRYNIYWEGKHIVAERAPLPGDIYWENLSVNSKSRAKKTLITYAVTLVCLGIAFGVNLSLHRAKESLGDGDDSGLSVWAVTGLLSLITSLFVIVVNMLLAKIIRILSKFEQHETYSKYNISVAVKLTIAMFINTAIIPMFVNFRKENWFDRGGLMLDIFYNTFSVSII